VYFLYFTLSFFRFLFLFLSHFFAIFTFFAASIELLFPCLNSRSTARDADSLSFVALTSQSVPYNQLSETKSTPIQPFRSFS